MTADVGSIQESDFAPYDYDDEHLTPKQKRAFVQLLSKYIRCVCVRACRMNASELEWSAVCVLEKKKMLQNE